MDLTPTLPAAATAKAAPANTDAAPQKAKEFEAMFLGQVVDQMLSTVDMGSFGGGHAEETWRSFLSDAIGQSLSDQGGTGIAESIEGAISRYRNAQDMT